jgi:AraC-like DNA-binding protein
MRTFSTTGHRPEEAFALWRTAISEQFVPLRPEPVCELSGFFGELRSLAVGALTLTEVCSTGHHVHRSRSEIARSAAEVFFFNVQAAGTSGVLCQQEAVATVAGDMFLFDSRRPFVLACESRMRHWCLAIPHAVLPAGAAVLERAHGLVLSPRDAAAALLGDYLAGLLRTNDALDGSLAEEVARHLIALVEHAVSRDERTRRAARSALREAQFARARRIIERRSRDPDFDPTRLAREMQVSVRYLQMLFAGRDSSPMRAIVQHRLERAMALLRDATQAHRTITTIAFDCGFRDLTHFGRTFAAATGQTPSQWRRGG